MSESEVGGPAPDVAPPRLAPRFVEVASSSMEPWIGKGCRVWIDRLEEVPLPGEIVLVRGDGVWILHRVLAVVESDREQLVFHRGDAGGAVGVCRAAAVAGKAVAFLEPRAPFPSLETMDAGFKRSFRFARSRCRLYCRLRGLARRLGLLRDPLRRPLRWMAGRLLSG